MDPAARGGSRRLSALPRLSALLVVTDLFGGVITILSSPLLYRGAGAGVIAALGACMAGLGLVQWWRREQGMLLRAAHPACGMAVLAACGLFCGSPALAQGLALGLGMMVLYPAVALPRRPALVLMALAFGESLGLLAVRGPQGPIVLALGLVAAAMCVIPALTVISFREQLEAALSQVVQIAATDALTGVANRRGLHEQVAGAFALAGSCGGVIGVLMVDIDHFKEFNDGHGHLGGDEMLKAVAEVLRSAVRPQDVVARFGGEEFCALVVLPDADQVTRIAERIRGAVAERTAVTVSIGVAVAHPDPDLPPQTQLWELIDRADSSLYRAKQGGRNLVEVAVDGAPPDEAAPDGAAPDGAAPDGAAPDGAAPPTAAPALPEAGGVR